MEVIFGERPFSGGSGLGHQILLEEAGKTIEYKCNVESKFMNDIWMKKKC